MSLILVLAAIASGSEPTWDALDAQDGWRDVGEKRSDVGPVYVQSKRYDGFGCVQGRTVSTASPAELVAVTNDMVSSIDWSSAELALSEELERDGTSFVLFQYMDVPGWMLTADRFWLIRGTSTSHDDGSASYRWERVDSAAHPDALERAQAISGRAIEPPVNFGDWHFVPTDEGTEVHYRACADFGGRVPAGLEHMVNTQQVPDLVADLVREATRRSH